MCGAHGGRTTAPTPRRVAPVQQEPPVEHYDDLEAEEIISLLGSLEALDLEALRDYDARPAPGRPSWPRSRAFSREGPCAPDPDLGTSRPRKPGCRIRLGCIRSDLYGNIRGRAPGGTGSPATMKKRSIVLVGRWCRPCSSRRCGERFRLRLHAEARDREGRDRRRRRHRRDERDEARQAPAATLADAARPAADGRLPAPALPLSAARRELATDVDAMVTQALDKSRGATCSARAGAADRRQGQQAIWRRA